jgi:hypothetical protein
VENGKVLLRGNNKEGKREEDADKRKKFYGYVLMLSTKKPG